jgi:hypothetical protein
MINTIDDFMKRFSSGGTMDDQMAVQMHDRFVSTRPEDNQFDNRAYHEAAAEYIGRLPDDQFRSAARNAATQVPPEQRQDLLGGLLGALKGGSAGDLGGIASMLGLSSTDPNKMSGDDAAKVMDYARKENPQALQQTVQEKPWFVKALGNPVVMGALTVAAAKLLSNQRKSA